MSLAPNTSDILAHLTVLFPPILVHPYPDAKIEIAYGAPDKGPHKGEWFSAFDLMGAAIFAAARNAERNNVYVGAALRKGDTAPFGRGDDAAFLAAAHGWIDLDGEGECAKARATVRELQLNPSIVVTTGTIPHLRMHVYFALQGGVADGEKLRQANAALISRLGGDPVQSPSHVMRLAGTVSYPSKKKQERGYVDELVTLRVGQNARPNPIERIFGLAALSATPNTGLGFDLRRSDAELAALLEDTRIDGRWHNSMVRAVATMIGRGWDDAAIRLSCAPYCVRGAGDPDLTPMILTGRRKWDKPELNEVPSLPARLALSSAEFCAGFTPPDYLIEGLLQRRFVYALTAATGTGKTAIALLIAALVALGHKLGKLEVAKGRVLFFAGENPDDIRMRWFAMTQQFGLTPEDMEVFFVPGVSKFSEIQERICKEMDGNRIALVIVDTSAAYYETTDENDNVQAGAHARRLRQLVQLDGGPTILICCHPVKNATDENLLPRGGGAFIAEVDGNLVCRKDDSAVSVHWSGKFRGPDFAPIPFMLKTVTHEHLKDTKGRNIPTVIARAISAEELTELNAHTRGDENKVLAHIAEHPDQTQRERALALGWRMANGEPYQMKAARAEKGLVAAGLIKKTRTGFDLTDKGRRELKKLDVSDESDDASSKGRPVSMFQARENHAQDIEITQ